MSLELQVYAPSFTDDLIGKLEERLNTKEMTVELRRDLGFTRKIGDLRFKFKLNKSVFQSLKGKDLTSSVPFEIKDFDLRSSKAALKPERSLLSKFLGIKPPEIFFAGRQIDERLKECNQVATFSCGAGDIFEFYFASMTTAILTELTGGEGCYPADNIWYDRKSIVEFTQQEWLRYESGFNDDSVMYQEFGDW